MASDILDRTPPKPDHRIPYGPAEFQFGDLRLPSTKPAPLVVFIHGGWWKAAYGLDYAGHLCEDLKHHGIATWSIEYARVGNPTGGFPGTFHDVAAGFDFITTLAKTYPLDLAHVVTAGHSAGGHLAFWLAGRPHIPESSPLHKPQPTVPIKAVVALAGAVDLRLTMDLAGWFTFAHDKAEVLALMGASPAEAPDRYAAGDPGELIPLNVPQYLIQGTEDDQIPPQLPIRWADRGRKRGEKIAVDIIPGADHFDIVDPQSKAWPRVRDTILKAVLQ